ncbi:hypothetical protein PZE19_16390 [Paludisphaera sp. Pla2]|uniref:Uncharacterized protein n=1 Tax=Paludisphaera mucosa TaxID=3030827 RepID=A0ABT6FCR5_9BACT|nr:hypothetical protein [Paludisphaera mucosa]MDG3005371.1 hypothetical protein [Paludisphaera mucosa]
MRTQPAIRASQIRPSPRRAYWGSSGTSVPILIVPTVNNSPDAIGAPAPRAQCAANIAAAARALNCPSVIPVNAAGEPTTRAAAAQGNRASPSSSGRPTR